MNTVFLDTVWAWLQLAAILTMDYLRREVAAGRREDFDRYLAVVPDVESAAADSID